MLSASTPLELCRSIKDVGLGRHCFVMLSRRRAGRPGSIAPCYRPLCKVSTYTFGSDTASSPDSVFTSGKVAPLFDDLPHSKDNAILAALPSCGAGLRPTGAEPVSAQTRSSHGNTLSNGVWFAPVLARMTWTPEPRVFKLICTSNRPVWYRSFIASMTIIAFDERSVLRAPQ